MGVDVENAQYAFRSHDLAGAPATVRFLSVEPLLGPIPELPSTGSTGVVVGGESGLRHRPLRAEWVVGVRDRRLARRVPFFFKQWGGLFLKSGGHRGWE